MYICYFDETGDDGFPKYSSELFVLTSLYMHYQTWKDNYSKVHDFRKQLKKDYNLPVSIEFHAKYFVTDKNPFRELNLSHEKKKEILKLFFELISILDAQIINVVINKKNIKSQQYDILDTALKYNVQRIENDLSQKDPANKFLIITDEGRVGKMVKTTRKIQKINFIPSKYSTASYRNDIQKLIEDPLPKRSNESYFIQVADTVSYVVHLYAQRKFLSGWSWPKRVLNTLNPGDDEELLTLASNVLNLKASSGNQFGIVHYPK